MRTREEIERESGPLGGLQLEVLLDIRDLLVEIRDGVTFATGEVRCLTDPNGPLIVTLNGIYANTAPRR